jgi:hypothetical protein
MKSTGFGNLALASWSLQSLAEDGDAHLSSTQYTGLSALKKRIHRINFFIAFAAVNFIKKILTKKISFEKP